MNYWIKVLACLVALGHSGCFRSMPRTHYYELRHSAPAAQSTSGPVLAIDQLEADAPYEDQRIVYRTSPFQLQYYTYHEWTAPPSLHLSDYLRTAYDATGVFRRVTRTPTAETSAVLTGRITAFEEVDESKDRWIGRVELELAALDPDTGEPLWSDHFIEEEPLREQSPEGLAAALSTAVTRIVQRSAPQIAAAVDGRSSAAAAKLE